MGVAPPLNARFVMHQSEPEPQQRPDAGESGALERVVRAEATSGPKGPWLVGFSGGPDSLALGRALATIEPLPPAEIRLLHVDHQLDGASAERAERARALAAKLGLPYSVERRDVRNERRRGENLEAAARRVRYAALETVRARLGAARILTAHHRDDQIETLLLRLRSGSGIFGLAGIQERRGAIWRPALHLSRAELHSVLAGSGLAPIEDPANHDLDRARNRIRHRLLPHLRKLDPTIDEALAHLAETAAAARQALTRRLTELYDLRATADGAELSATALARHPPLLSRFALGLLEQRAGFVVSSSGRARREMLRQILESAAGEVEAAGGRRLRRLAGDRLALASVDSGAGGRKTNRPPFSYFVTAPGEVAVPEAGGRFRLTRSAVEPWMRRGEAGRAAIVLPEPPPELEVRNRRPGDRLRPLGAPGMRALKALLIDRKVPRAERDRIPLLVLAGRVVWVPGVTIDHGCRLRGESDCWVVEWLPDRRAASTRSTFRRALFARPEEADT